MNILNKYALVNVTVGNENTRVIAQYFTVENKDGNETLMLSLPFQCGMFTVNDETIAKYCVEDVAAVVVVEDDHSSDDI